MRHRIDIQALRGFAVLIVVLYHAKLFWIDGGFLGVDVFFVISGFLITSQIHQRLESNNFSFREFYLQRAWRLLPAAYVVFFLCCIFAPSILSNSELTNFKEQILGAITFTSNIVLWTQTGYFEDSANVKPLLHTWSLSIEEQYYLIVPAVLYLLHKNKHCLSIFILLTAASFLLMSFKMPSMPGAMFYLTPARVWEIGIGSILALFILKSSKTLPNWLGYVGLLILLFLPYKLYPAGDHTEINLLVATLATAFIIGADVPLFSSSLISRVLAKIGNFSYSLYLVHWPIFAFANSAMLHDNNLWWLYRIGLVIVSFVLAWLLYYFIESKFRIKTHTNQRNFTPLFTSSIALIALVTIITNLSYNDKNYPHEFRANVGFSIECSEPEFFENQACRSAQKPEMLVWGDSYAMHLIPGLTESADQGLIQATRPTCAPLSTIAIYRPPKFNRSWSENCIKFNQSVYDYISQNEDLQTVVLASAWGYLFTDLTSENKHAKLSEGQLNITTVTKQGVSDDLIKLVKQIQSLGKKVVIISSPPNANFNIAKCHERIETNKWRFGANEDCTINLTEYSLRAKDVVSLIDSLRQSKLAVYSFSEKLCNNNKCVTKLDDIILYRDMGHLSINGSKYYANRFNFYQEIKSLANNN